MSLIFALDLLDLGSLDRNFSDTNIDMLYIYIYIYIYSFPAIILLLVSETSAR